MNLKGKISIGRPQGRDYISIEIIDHDAGVQFVEAQVKYADFACLLTGQSHVHCALNVRGLDLVGTVREHKTEHVPYEHQWGQSAEEKEEAMRKALEPFEVDGWKGRVSDLLNQHKRNNAAGTQAVIFERNVPKDEPTDD